MGPDASACDSVQFSRAEEGGDQISDRVFSVSGRGMAWRVFIVLACLYVLSACSGLSDRSVPCVSSSDAGKAIIAAGAPFDSVKTIHCYERGWAHVEYSYTAAAPDTWGEAYLTYQGDKWVSLAQGGHGGDFLSLLRNPPRGMPPQMAEDVKIRWGGGY